jgi:hypothetical protein
MCGSIGRLQCLMNIPEVWITGNIPETWIMMQTGKVRG